jgi:hypothetical protein
MQGTILQTSAKLPLSRYVYVRNLHKYLGSEPAQYITSQGPKNESGDSVVLPYALDISPVRVVPRTLQVSFFTVRTYLIRNRLARLELSANHRTRNALT